MEEDELLPQRVVWRKWGEGFEGLFGVWLRHGSHPEATFVSHLTAMRQKIADSLESKLSGKLTGLTKKR